MPLSTLKLRDGEWSYSIVYAEIATAKDWGRTPSEFRSLSEEDRAMMIAYTRATGKMRAWERQEQEREMDRIAAKNRR